MGGNWKSLTFSSPLTKYKTFTIHDDMIFMDEMTDKWEK